MTDEQQQLLAFIAQHTGLEINQQRQQTLKPFLDELLDSISALDLIEVLSSRDFTHPTWQRIIQAMTIGETYFFRNQYHFLALRNHILPELIERRRTSGLKQLRLWCAGCSTGEEPYSIAILLQELLPDIQDWSITLLATDINDAYLAFAKHGIYNKRSFRNETPEAVIQQWFNPIPEGYQVKGAVRRKVVFSALNLVSDDYPAYTNNTMQMDLIICRNVTIYFDSTTTKTVAERFHRALGINGWLLVGHSEPNMEIYKDFTVRNFENAILYQKTVDIQAFERAKTQPIPHLTIAPRIQKKTEPIPAPRVAIKPRTAPVVPQLKEKENYLELARQAANTEKWDEALKLLVEAERYDNLNPHIHYLRGLVYHHQGNLKEAVTVLQRAVYCDVQFSLGHYMLGDIYATLGEEKKAVRHWRSALQTLAPYDLNYELPFSDGLTVEMLNGMIAYRLK
jgi:chemotaxis protein methyltransferase CheR